MRKGWFKIPGRQEGDRTIEEQMLGLDPALAEARDRTVLDVGCAEGAIAAAFARAGASRVVGIELLQDHINMARKVCKGFRVEFIVSELAKWIDEHPEPEQFDIVLLLGIAHKLHDPVKAFRFAALSAKDLICFRGPGKTRMWDGWLHAKFGDGKVHVPTLMSELGFVDEKTIDGARGERVQYWRRK